MSKYKCIIFDCDGVLVDSELIGNRVLVEMANEVGAKIDLDFAHKNFKGNVLKSCLRQIEELAEDKLPNDFETEFRRRSFEKFKTDIQPIKGVKDVLNALEIPFCVASSGPENKIKLNLKLTCLLPYFENKIFSCYTVGKWKPDPAVFLWAAKTMGYQPKDCLVIEDSPIGVNGALNGGFNVLGFIAHDEHNELKKLGIETFDNMLNLPPLLT